jgi:iron complex transport system substrate-binding protein
MKRMEMKKALGLFLVFIIMLTLAGCAGEAPVSEKTAETITVTDMFGRTITLKSQIDRVVASTFEVSELIFSVAGESAVEKILAVGKTKSVEVVKALYAEKYPNLASLPDIGGGKGSDLDLEAIIALKPDVFILNTTDPDSLSAMVLSLEKAKIPTVMLDVQSNPMENSQPAIELLGQIFDQDDRAKEIGDFINTQFQLVEEKKLYEKEHKPTVYVEKGSGTANDYDVTFTSGGWAEIIRLAGGENIAADASAANSTQIDPEYLIKSDPDFIVIAGSVGFDATLDEADAVFAEYLQRTGWNRLKAVQANNLYQLSHSHSRDQFCFFPTLMLAKLFHPDEMAGVNPTEVLREYFERYMLVSYDRGIWFNAIQAD